MKQILEDGEGRKYEFFDSDHDGKLALLQWEGRIEELDVEIANRIAALLNIECTSRPMTAQELREYLDGLVGERFVLSNNNYELVGQVIVVDSVELDDITLTIETKIDELTDNLLLQITPTVPLLPM
ncbi:MAG: hypothetical protein AAB373_01595 [Patescibacteria group bacterium]